MRRGKICRRWERICHPHSRPIRRRLRDSEASGPAVRSIRGYLLKASSRSPVEAPRSQYYGSRAVVCRRRRMSVIQRHVYRGFSLHASSKLVLTERQIQSRIKRIKISDRGPVDGKRSILYCLMLIYQASSGSIQRPLCPYVKKTASVRFHAISRLQQKIPSQILHDCPRRQSNRKPLHRPR